MSWLNLNESFNSLKGQITNFASEVLSEGPASDQDVAGHSDGAQASPKEEACQKHDLEISSLKKQVEELQALLQSERNSRLNGVKNEEESSWYWDPPQQTDSRAYQVQIRALQDEISTLKERGTIDLTPATCDAEEEINRLREENKNLTANLEDLDNQHQLAMDRLLTLKKELQKNFEILKQEHEELKNSNDDYSDENKMLLAKISERDKELEALQTIKNDHSTLHHKYVNLERVYGVLRENAEKFQEENQELHEEVFKLQEQVTKLEHDLEVANKNAEATDMISKEKYDELLKELNDLRERKPHSDIHLDEINIDDNAKSVIENLKRDINELKHKLSEKDPSDHKSRDETIMKLYNKYINFEIPLDLVGDIPSVGEDLVLYKVESVFRTVNSFKKNIDNLEQQLSEKNLTINHMQSQIDDITAENDFLTSDIQQLETELSEMKKNNDFLLNEITALKNTSKLEPIIETHEDNIAKLESDLADSNKLNKTFEDTIKRIQQELEEVVKEKVILQESLKDLKTKYTEMLNQVEICENKTTEAVELQTKFNETQTDMKHEDINELKTKLNEANTKNEQLSIDIHIIENDKVLLTKQIDHLKHSLEEKSSAHKELETLKTALDKKLHDFELKLDEVIRHKAEVENEKTKLEEKVVTLENQMLEMDSTNKELDKLKEEKVKLTEKSTAFGKENATLKETVKNLMAQINYLQLREQNLMKQTGNMKQITIIAKNADGTDELKTIQPGDVDNELTKLQNENKKLKNELATTESRIIHLEQDFERVLGDLEEKENQLDELNTTCKEDKLTVFRLNRTVEELQQSEAVKNDELERLRLRCESLSNQLINIRERFNQSHEELFILRNNSEDMGSELNRIREEVAHKNTEIESFKIQLNETETARDEYKTLVIDKDKEIDELKQKITELSIVTEKVSETTASASTNDKHDVKEIVEKDVTELKNNLTVKEKEIEVLKTKVTDYEKQITELNTTINKSTVEKTELINLVNMKHNESLQYHNEIQRLNQVIVDQTNDFKTIIEEKDKLINNQLDRCVNCENYKVGLKEKDEIIITLNNKVGDYDRVHNELANATEIIKALTEKCDHLDKNLTIQLEAVKKLTAENAQLCEQEQSCSRELSRLRSHLVSTEERYTQELVASEQRLNDTLERLRAVEDRAKHTNTLYTSNSIRANQEVETLRNQIRLLERQREEMQTRVSEAEDARSRSEAALTNLQIVLEQFQLDKERDIHSSTEKLRSRLEALREENTSLLEEIAVLKGKLEESAAGLQAAARLGDQLQNKTALINDLKEQVRALQASASAAEERYRSVTSGQQDRVDKQLVRNLLVNYVLANDTSKLQVLRVLSTVLDLNQSECIRLGLTRSPATDTSLAAEFVRFLQDESTPRANTSHRSHTTSRKSSVTSQPPILETTPNSHKRNPSTGSNNLLLSTMDPVETASLASRTSRDSLELRPSLETGVTQTRNNEGAILKHVLRDM